MTVIHIAIFKWKPEVTAERIAAVFEKTRALKDQIPGVRAIYGGANQTHRAPGFTHALLVLCDSQAALDAYNAHPAHREIATELDDIMAERVLGVDFTD